MGLREGMNRAQTLEQQFRDYARPAELPAVVGADKWVLTSALHKAVRLGLRDNAVAAAHALWHADRGYLWRRVPVIALEDIGVGDLVLCVQLVDLSRTEARDRAIDSPEFAGFVGGVMAAAIRSRAACDVLSLVNALAGPDGFDTASMSWQVDEAIAIACTHPEPVRRAEALLWLNALPATQDSPRLPALSRLSEQLRLPPLVGQLLRTGEGTHGLAAVLPVAYELLQAAPARVVHADAGLEAEVLAGAILCSALDMHTRMGRKAISLWVKTVPAFKALIGARPGVDAELLAQMAVFHREGSVLRSRITNDPLDELRVVTEHAELERLGMEQAAGDDLYRLIDEYRPVLNQIRRRLWRAQAT